jgi:hypothetical protein
MRPARYGSFMHETQVKAKQDAPQSPTPRLERPKTVVHGPHETTLESVARHFRADEHLKPEDVDHIMKVLLEQYTFLRKRNQEVVPG